MTPDFWPDLRVFLLLVTPAVLVLAAIWAHAVWRQHHPRPDKETDQ